jgi:hypothetical protein
MEGKNFETPDMVQNQRLDGDLGLTEYLFI